MTGRNGDTLDGEATNLGQSGRTSWGSTRRAPPRLDALQAKPASFAAQRCHSHHVSSPRLRAARASPPFAPFPCLRRLRTPFRHKAPDLRKNRQRSNPGFARSSLALPTLARVVLYPNATLTLMTSSQRGYVLTSSHVPSIQIRKDAPRRMGPWHAL